MTVASNLGLGDNDQARGRLAELEIGKVGIQVKIATMGKTRYQSSAEVVLRARVPLIDVSGVQTISTNNGECERAVLKRKKSRGSVAAAVQAGMPIRQVEMATASTRLGGPMLGICNALINVVPAVRAVIVVRIDSDSNTGTVLVNMSRAKVDIEIVDAHAQLPQLHHRKGTHR